MKKLIVAILLCLALPAWGQTIKIKETTLPNGLVVHEYRLKNGMQVLLVPDHSAPVVTFQVWFKAGSVAEKMDPKLKRTGLAHLFEHMMFRGTPRNPDQVFDQKLSAAGAVGMNATTWVDRTNYFESVPKEALELVFQLESDRMTNLAINEKLFQTELGAVFGEKKMGEDKPGRVAYEKLWNLAFDEHPYRWSVIGTEEELKSFTVKDAMHFYKTYYAPNNAALIVLGDIKIPATLKLAERYYGKKPSQKIPAIEPDPEPEQKKAKSLTLTHPLASSSVVMLAYKIPAMDHGDTPALDVAAAVLAYGNGSWLERELVQENIVSSVTASASGSKYPGLFVLSAQMAPGKEPEKALEVIRSALERLKKGKVTEAELERAKNQYLLATYGDLLSLNSIGRTLGEALVRSEDYLKDFENLEKVKGIGMEELRKVANAYFQEDRSSLVTVNPGKGEKE